MTVPGDPSVVAIVLAGISGAVLVRGRPAVLGRLAGPRQRPGRGVQVCVAAVPAALVGVVVVGVLPVVTAVGLTALGWRQLRRREALREVERRRDVLGELLSALVAELRSGADPRPAVRAAATGLAGLEPLVTAASRPSGDVGAALSVLARAPGGSSAGELAAAWRVCEMTGCGLAAPVARVLRGHRTGDRLRREVAAQLAGPRATAHLLAALPLVGTALGTALGADPLGFLLGTPVGRVVLAVGVTLLCAGVAWSGRIVAAATTGWEGPGGGWP